MLSGVFHPSLSYKYFCRPLLIHVQPHSFKSLDDFLIFHSFRFPKKCVPQFFINFIDNKAANTIDLMAVLGPTAASYIFVIPLFEMPEKMTGKLKKIPALSIGLHFDF